MDQGTSAHAPDWIGCLLAAVEAGDAAGAARSFADDAVVDVTLPHWRTRACGVAAIAEAYATWCRRPGRLEEVDRRRTADGEVVSYLVSWLEGGVPMATRRCHVITLDEAGRIAGDAVFASEVWTAATMAAMQEVADRG